MPRLLVSILAAALLFAAGCTTPPAAPPPVAITTPQVPATSLAQKRVLVLGDSITQDGRYVTFLEYYLQRLVPGAQCDLISIGLSAETVAGLTESTETYVRPCALERLDRALKAVKPQLVLACYGMNDGIYHPTSPEILAAFNAGLRQLITSVRAAGAELILITPPVFEPVTAAKKTVPLAAGNFGYSRPYIGYDTTLAELGAAELALREPGVTTVDLHTPMAAALAARRAANPAFAFSNDGVHPGDAGHLLMARIIGAALGLPLPAVELEPELARVSADPAFNLVRARRTLRSEAWLPFVGYTTRGNTYKSASVEAAERVAKLLQAQVDAQLSGFHK